MDKQNTSLETLLAELNQSDKPLRAALIYRLSDISAEDLAIVAASWSTVAVERRRQLMVRLSETSETNFDVDFTEFALFGLTDDDPQTRASAIAALWFSEEPRVMSRFLSLLKEDESTEVRSAAAEALGKFVLASELGDIPEALGHEAEEALLEVIHQEDEALSVHMRALESLAYSGRDELAELISEAFTSDNIEVKASAVFAMGRSADDRWNKQVIKALNSPEPQLRFEAIRAAGELGLTAVVGKIFRMANEPDREIREIAIWSLGEIGGTEAQNALMKLADTESDEDLVEVIEDALSSAQLIAGNIDPILLGGDMDFDIDDLDELDFDD